MEPRSRFTTYVKRGEREENKSGEREMRDGEKISRKRKGEQRERGYRDVVEKSAWMINCGILGDLDARDFNSSDSSLFLSFLSRFFVSLYQ